MEQAILVYPMKTCLMRKVILNGSADNFNDSVPADSNLSTSLNPAFASHTTLCLSFSNYTANADRYIVKTKEVLFFHSHYFFLGVADRYFLRADILAEAYELIDFALHQLLERDLD